MKVPMLDLPAQYRAIQEEVDAAVAEVFESQYFILGPKVEACEKAISDYCGCGHAIGVSSGSDALLVSLMAEGIGAGDEVITTPYTFFATAGAILRLCAKPVFVDINPETYNINPNFIEQKITDRTKAIIPVHLFGQMADMAPIMELAEEYDLLVVEDAAQAIGAEYRGQKAGSIGHYGCFSFFPSKNLGGAGDGGMVTTNDEDRANKLRILRVHGAAPKYHHKIVGGNFRLDAIQAAVVHAKLAHLDDWTKSRRAHAEKYRRLIAASDAPVEVPRERVGYHVYNQFVVRVSDRDNLKEYLGSKEVSSSVYYPRPLHLQECLLRLGYKKGNLSESEQAAQETLALPLYPEMTHEMIKYVVTCISEYFQGSE